MILIGLIVILGFTAPNSFTVTNLLNILRTSSMQGVIAFGMPMVIISGEIDLSVSRVSSAGWSACVSASLHSSSRWR
jgi:ribose/xylose/arabinose/galactoside ABC-type transport system permease subunit